MAAYQLTETDAVIRTSDNAHIPADPANSDYEAYLKWVEDGGVPDPYVPPPPTRQQEATAHKAGGLTITFEKDPHLTGTYPVIQPHSLAYNAISTGIANNEGFPHNLPTVEIFDIAGQPHRFSKILFSQFIKQVRNFVYGCNLYAAGERVDLPPNNVSSEFAEPKFDLIDLVP